MTSEPGFNPYTQGRSSGGLGRLVTVLAVIFGALLVVFYAKQGYDNARFDCLSQASASQDVVAEFSLSWMPPFGVCTINGQLQSV
ncbi:hypothetical protein V5R04_05085 [Jonesiaceae bacterium BS-20]|uniref:Transmembrane protein n=1 Tax=Jonesiaceae bacterium BS-20 TaxID=3120821 RepID=A0AAU7DXP9_9MICO